MREWEKKYLHYIKAANSSVNGSFLIKAPLMFYFTLGVSKGIVFTGQLC